MKTYPLLVKLHGHMYAFELENLYIGKGKIVSLLSKMDDVINAQMCKMFSKSCEIRAEFKYHDKEEVGAFRVIYVAKFEQAVYVLHAFQKKTRATAKADIDLATQRYKLIGETR